MDQMQTPAVTLGQDGREMTVTLGEYTATYGRTPEQEPFSDSDIEYVRAATIETVTKHRESGFTTGRKSVNRVRLPGGWQVWVHVNTGPPTWWLPRVSLRRRFMVGWLRGLVAVRVDRREQRT